ncbi:MAG: hypothetical protein ACRDO8_07205 [Nocardioidaceae bacterium]
MRRRRHSRRAHVSEDGLATSGNNLDLATSGNNLDVRTLTALLTQLVAETE